MKACYVKIKIYKFEMSFSCHGKKITQFFLIESGSKVALKVAFTDDSWPPRTSNRRMATDESALL